MSLLVRILLVLAVVGALAGGVAAVNHWDNGRLDAAREQGRQEVRTEMQAKALDEERTHARETLRRLEAQKEHQDEQNRELAAARADADRNRADADQLREQAADAARQWRDALGHSPSVAECAAAGTAIVVQADVLGRADGAASELAAYSDAARAHGLKCERDYDSLMPSTASDPAPQPTKGASDGTQHP
jgi:hypothetical protein